MRDLEAVGQAVAVRVGIVGIGAEGALAVVGEAVVVGVGRDEVEDGLLLGRRDTGERAAREPDQMVRAGRRHGGIHVLGREVHEDDTGAGRNGDVEGEVDEGGAAFFRADASLEGRRARLERREGP